MKRKGMLAAVALGAVSLLLLATDYAFAHCDGLDGPVVNAARKALATNNVNYVLVWVQKENEPELRAVFQQTLAVRKLNPESQALADRHLFETVVRLHRAGEGAPYNGLQPAGRDLGPAIPAADRAVESGDLGDVEKLLIKDIRSGLAEAFEPVKARRNYDPNDLDAGRQYVKAYVEYVHFVERLHEAATRAAAGHYAEAETH
jgi:hypothetical protein